jgi:GxxExxY protein
VIKGKHQIKSMIDIEALAKKIYSHLGSGYSERVYHNCMEVILRKEGIQYESERIIPIHFEGHVVGNLRGDIIINNTIVLEFKAVKTLNDIMESQVRNYLRLTGLKCGCLINFPIHPGRGVEVRHIVAEEQ